MDLRARAFEVLQNTHLMSLATTDEGGVWVAYVIFIYDDDLNLYFMSDPECRHSEAIVKNGKAAGAISVGWKSKQNNFCLQFAGEAKKIEGPRYDLARKHLAKRGKPPPTETDDVLEGDSWYQLTPTMMELIDEEHFGYDKQKIL